MVDTEGLAVVKIWPQRDVSSPASPAEDSTSASSPASPAEVSTSASSPASPAETRFECVECDAPLTDFWEPGECCIGGTLGACSRKCAASWCTKNNVDLSNIWECPASSPAEASTSASSPALLCTCEACRRTFELADRCPHCGTDYIPF